MSDNDKALAIALARYQVISAYVAMDPPRGRRRQLLEELANKSWAGPDGEPWQVAAETIRTWVRRYRREGLDGLRNKTRPCRGTSAMSEELVEYACALKREVPERTLDRLIVIMEGMGKVEPGEVSRSTLHRRLQAHGLSRGPNRIPDAQDLDRFEADYPNELWQSDLLVGPWLPDPVQPSKMRRAHLYAFIDDHSRLMLHGRFSFKGELPALELVFRRSLQKYGVPSRVYYDNGQVYKARHMKLIVAELGIHRIIHTQAYRPMGHGKIEAFNRFVRRNFLAELKASSIKDLDSLNEAFVAWVDLYYNRRPHSETGQVPIDRWRAGLQRIRWADEEALRKAFLWHEKRSTDKSGLFSLFGTRYQVGPELAKRRIDVRYDPERLELIEVHHQGRFVERVSPFGVQRHRRPTAKAEPTDVTDQAKPTADWLGHLVAQRKRDGFIEPTPKQLAQKAAARRRAADDAVVDELARTLDEAAFDEPAVREHLERYGPYDADRVAAVLQDLLRLDDRIDRHVTFYLDAIRQRFQGEQQ